MDEFSNTQENATEDKREEIKQKLRQYYEGRIVRKDLTKSIREGANVPVYVLEYLLGQYCNSDDEEIIEEGVENVKRILRDNYVRPDEAQKILSLLRERGSYTVIDRITVVLNTKEDRYEATFSNLGVKGIPIHPDYVKDYPDYERLHGIRSIFARKSRNPGKGFHGICRKYQSECGYTFEDIQLI